MQLIDEAGKTAMHTRKRVQVNINAGQYININAGQCCMANLFREQPTANEVVIGLTLNCSVSTNRAGL